MAKCQRQLAGLAASHCLEWRDFFEAKRVTGTVVNFCCHAGDVYLDLTGGNVGCVSKLGTQIG